MKPIESRLIAIPRAFLSTSDCPYFSVLTDKGQLRVCDVAERGVLGRHGGDGGRGEGDHGAVEHVAEADGQHRQDLDRAAGASATRISTRAYVVIVVQLGGKTCVLFPLTTFFGSNADYEEVNASTSNNP